jgi:hypothetical protein
MTTPPRVLLPSDVFPPRCGGAGWSAHALALALIERGHAVTAIVPRRPTTDDRRPTTDDGGDDAVSPPHPHNPPPPTSPTQGLQRRKNQRRGNKAPPNPQRQKKISD